MKSKKIKKKPRIIFKANNISSEMPTKLSSIQKKRHRENDAIKSMIQKTIAKSPNVLGELLAPISIETFIKSYWEQRPLIIRSAKVNQKKTVLILSSSELWEAIRSNRFPVHIFQFIDKFDAEPSWQEFSIQFDGDINRLDVNKIGRFFSEGGSVILNQFDMFHNKAAFLTRCLSETLRCNTNCNVYYTPRQSRAYLNHWDISDGFVCQIEGSKVWKIYRPVIPLPLKNFHSVKNYIPYSPGKPIISTTLNPGDILYIPRGFPHEGHASGQDSLHVTIGVENLTGHDFLAILAREALKNCSNLLSLRRGSPILYSGKGSNRLIDKWSHESIDLFCRVLRALPHKELSEIDTIKAMELEREGEPHPRKILKKINLSTVLVRRRGLCFLNYAGSRIVLRFSGKEIEMPSFLMKGVQYILANVCYQVGQLPLSKNSDKITLAKKLVNEGLLYMQ